MQFDIVRAWKDESYRQSLSAEQRNALPANPVGELELSDTELETICGGSHCAHSSGGNIRVKSSIYVASNMRVESMALLACEVNIYSINILPVLSSVVQVCKQG